MNLDLHPGERSVRDGAANMQRGIEAVGGRLFLTDARLVFHSHAFNVQTGVTEVPLHEVRSVARCWTRLFGLLPLVPNSISVRTDRAEHRFVVFGRAGWVEAIRSAVAALDAVPLAGTSIGRVIDP